MSKDQPEQGVFDFEKLDAMDGFKIRRVDFCSESSLHLCVYQGGTQTPLLAGQESSVEVAAWPRPNEKDFGESIRLQLLLEALCRYFTTGGDWQTMMPAVKKMSELLPVGLTFQGWHYVEGYVNTEGRYEHLFAKDGTDVAAVWVEDSFIELKQIVRDEEEPDEQRPRREEPRHLELPGPADPEKA